MRPYLRHLYLLSNYEPRMKLVVPLTQDVFTEVFVAVAHNEFHFMLCTDFMEHEFKQKK